MSAEESMDIKDQLEEECAKTLKCIALYNKLILCTQRVKNNPKTEETCVEELFDLTPCVDKCVAPKLFSKLR